MGLQFHLEADTDKIEYWLVGHACELVQAEVDLQQIRNNAKREGQRLQAAAWQTMTEWLDAALT
ncbi:transposase [Neisseria perflava]|uniref:hypothetical protein n=1 Tax=Neisseria perflava TaxID=33053 RepID=UPI0020A1D7B0|nr:hypothetical protein [Neisseria perflava]MCP1772229.1 transposase [Neisseria perflava]